MNRTSLGAIALGLCVWSVSCIAVAADGDDAGNLRYAGAGPHYVTSGKLGIGTDAPAERLDIAGNVRLGQGPNQPTTLTADVLGSHTTIPVLSTEGYPDSGTLLIDSEVIRYIGKTPTAFMGVKRGEMGSNAVTHNVGTAVKNYLLTIQRQAADLNTSGRIPQMVVTGEGFVGVGTATPLSKLQVKGGYFQLPRKAFGDPPAADCDHIDEAGRMIFESSIRRWLWVCDGAHGWKYAPLSQPPASGG